MKLTAQFTLTENSNETICKTCHKVCDCPFYEARVNVDEVEDCSEYHNEKEVNV